MKTITEEPKNNGILAKKKGTIKRSFYKPEKQII